MLDHENVFVFELHQVADVVQVLGHGKSTVDDGFEHVLADRMAIPVYVHEILSEVSLALLVGLHKLVSDGVHLLLQVLIVALELVTKHLPELLIYLSCLLWICLLLPLRLLEYTLHLINGLLVEVHVLVGFLLHFLVGQLLILFDFFDVTLQVFHPLELRSDEVELVGMLWCQCGDHLQVMYILDVSLNVLDVLLLGLVLFLEVVVVCHLLKVVGWLELELKHCVDLWLLDLVHCALLLVHCQYLLLDALLFPECILTQELLVLGKQQPVHFCEGRRIDWPLPRSSLTLV